MNQARLAVTSERDDRPTQPRGRKIGRAFVTRADQAARRRAGARRSPPRRPVPAPVPADEAESERASPQAEGPQPKAPQSEEPPNWATSISAAALVAAVVTAPWLLGIAGTYHAGVAVAALGVLACGLAWRSGSGVLPAVLWPLAGWLLLGAAQAVSPVFGPALETSSGGLASHLAPVSVARSATREALAVAVLGVLAFLTATRAGSAPASRRVVWWGLTGGVAAFAVVGLAGRLGLWVEYGWITAGDADGLVGPFFGGMNRSHSAELLNFGLAAALALMATGGGRPAAACGAVIAAGLVVNGSRAGLAAVPVGLALTGAALAWLTRRDDDPMEAAPAGPAIPFELRRAGWVCAAGVATVAAGVALSLWQFEVDETGLGRLEDSRNQTFREAIAGRWNHWTDAVGVAADLPLFGAGLGTHRFATPPYQSAASSAWFTHADNQYVETLVETGVVGMALLAVAVFLLGRGVWRAGQLGAVDALVAAAYAAGAAAVHAGFDYGITRPPVLLAAAALFGTAYGAGATTRGGTARLLGGAVAVALGLAGGWAAYELWLAAPATPHRELNTVEGDAVEWSEVAVDAEIARLSAAVEDRPDDVEARYVLGRLLMRKYRETVTAGLRADPATAEAPEALLRRLTDPGFGAYVALGPDGAEAVRQVRQDERVRETLAPAFEHLSAARAASPFVPRLDYHLARIAWAVASEEPSGERFLASLHRNFPADVIAQAAAARRAERLGLTELADRAWRTTLMLDPARAANVAAALADERPEDPGGATLGDADAARFLTLLPPDHADRLIAAAAVSPRFPALAAAAAERLLTEDPAPRERAVALRLTGEAASAVEAMETHLAAQPRDLAARAMFAGWLIDDGEFAAAADQIAILDAVGADGAAAARLSKRLDRARRDAVRSPVIR